MTKTQLRLNGIEVNKIDNGYRVSPSYEYTVGNKSVVMDKEDHYGIKCFTLSINDNVLTNFFGKRLYWENREDALRDAVRILYGKMPENYHTFA